jgi:tRNA/tmRNA/rRNA uracil-C5-methylase (TrmA/RlmC/RlmD family)
VEAVTDGEGVGCGLLVVDPPRKGLDEEVLTVLEMQRMQGDLGQVTRIIYVSCGYEALERDSRRLIEAGWGLTHAKGFLLFPGSDHLETVAVFDRG